MRLTVIDVGLHAELKGGDATVSRDFNSHFPRIGIRT